MHPEAYAFVREAVQLVAHPYTIVDLGGRNVNGSSRSLFPRWMNYISVDRIGGPGVDVIEDASTYGRDEFADLVICTETLEHTSLGKEIIANAYRILNVGGLLIVTCATYPRAAHSAIDGGTLRKGEYYKNVAPHDLYRWMDKFINVVVEVFTGRGDLYAVGWKQADNE